MAYGSGTETKADLIRAGIERDVSARGVITYQAVIRSNGDDTVIARLGPTYETARDAELESARQWNALQRPFRWAREEDEAA